MPSRSQKKWDEKYAGKAHRILPAPAEWLLAHLVSLPSGRAIDLATGLGGSAVELARRGWHVTAIDIQIS